MHRSGFSLLEIIVAIVILLIGLAAILRLSSITQTASLAAEELAIVQVACQTKLNEILATKARPISTGFAGQIENVRYWNLYVELYEINRPGMIGVRIYADKQPPGSTIPEDHYELVRWIQK